MAVQLKPTLRSRRCHPVGCGRQLTARTLERALGPAAFRLERVIVLWPFLVGPRLAWKRRPAPWRGRLASARRDQEAAVATRRHPSARAGARAGRIGPYIASPTRGRHSEIGPRIARGSRVHLVLVLVREAIVMVKADGTRLATGVLDGPAHAQLQIDQIEQDDVDLYFSPCLGSIVPAWGHRDEVKAMAPKALAVLQCVARLKALLVALGGKSVTHGQQLGEAVIQAPLGVGKQSVFHV